ncbi:hypothetical protein EON63_11915 [archaeon]|nr:MAG: hypothetical protein EON63_11915 [archaeon]
MFTLFVRTHIHTLKGIKVICSGVCVCLYVCKCVCLQPCVHTHILRHGTCKVCTLHLAIIKQRR